ncbi:MAG: DUF4364 family protein [Clostridia bacterium]|nr:DUF4364 family protein [Clostridia bacterium]
MQIPITDKNEIKIFVLYLMKNVGMELDFNNVSDIVIQDNVVSYFDFAICFAELVEAGHVLVDKNENGVEMYRVSPTGAEVADELSSSILSNIREISLQNAKRHLSFQRIGASVDCHSEDVGDGKYRVTFEIRQKDGGDFRISVMADSKQNRDRMMLNFKRRPDVVYRGTLALLSGDVNYIFEP